MSGDDVLASCDLAFAAKICAATGPLPPSRQVVGSLAHFLDRRRKLTLFASLARLIASSCRSVLVRGSVPLPFSPWENLFSFSLTVTRPSVHNRDITNLRPERPGEGRRTDAQTSVERTKRGPLDRRRHLVVESSTASIPQKRFNRHPSLGGSRRSPGRAERWAGQSPRARGAGLSCSGMQPLRNLRPKKE